MSSCYFFCMAELADTSWRYFYGGTRRTWLNVLGSAIHNFVTTTLHLNKRIPDFHSITGCPIIIAWIEYTRSMGQVPYVPARGREGWGERMRDSTTHLQHFVPIYFFRQFFAEYMMIFIEFCNPVSSKCLYMWYFLINCYVWMFPSSSFYWTARKILNAKKYASNKLWRKDKRIVCSLCCTSPPL